MVVFSSWTFVSRYKNNQLQFSIIPSNVDITTELKFILSCSYLILCSHYFSTCVPLKLVAVNCTLHISKICVININVTSNLDDATVNIEPNNVTKKNRIIS